jgi:glycerophosphoryl diester phosphodiesterase
MLRYLTAISSITLSLLAVSSIAIARENKKDEPIEHSAYQQNNHNYNSQHKSNSDNIQLGPRPFYLVENMDESPLKKQLQRCEKLPIKKTNMSIGHRGAAMQFPEHTKESYQAAAKMGAGILECDVTFTKDRELVCRHSQCDLHTTTNILAIPELAAKCSQPFSPFDPITGQSATAACCASDITLEEFKTLKGKMDGANSKATNVTEYMQGTAPWRTDLYASNGTVLSHKESIRLFKKLGVKFTPELKSASVPMPFEGTYTQAMYAQQMLDEYRDAGVSPRDVWAQSFDIEDIRYWISQNPRFGKQAVYLDDANEPSELPTAEELQGYADEGFNIVAPPLWALLTLDQDNKIIPSDYAKGAKAAGLDIITWSFERAGPLQNGGGWYYQTVTDAMNNDGDMYDALDVLVQDVGVIGVFSDWPATVSYYANCVGAR